MKKRMLLFVTAIILLVSCTSLLAGNIEKGDTLWVDPMDDSGGPLLGALNMAIHNDTTATGENAHKVYELQPNVHYILTEVININTPITIYAPEPDDTHRPPVVRCGVNESGENVNNWWHIFADVTFKNIWMSGINLDGTGGINWIMQTVNATGLQIKYEGCIIEAPYTGWAIFADWAGNNAYEFNNCYFQNIGSPSAATWNGAVFTSDNAGSMIVRNSTFYKFGAWGVRSAFETEVDHCTFINSVVHPLDNHSGVNRKYTNNLFVNCHAFSDDNDEIKKHFDQEVKGIMNYAEIQWDPQRLDSLWGPGGLYGKSWDPNGDGVLTDDEMIWELENNVWWYTQPITDYWAQFPEVTPNPWMNNYNKAMFENQDGPWSWSVMTYTRDTNNVIIDSSEVTIDHQPYKYFSEINTMNVDPGIVNMNGTDALLAQNCINIRNELAGQTVTHIKWHNVDNYLAFTWPLNYDLSYTNTTLQTAGRDGKPIGSLQWWDTTYEPTSIEEDVNVATTFNLEQNYPNPFNPTTTISYNISKDSNVKLTVYDIMGKEVRSLVNTNKNVGKYNVVWNGKNNSGVNVPTGIYFYKLQSNNKTLVKKMMLMK